MANLVRIERQLKKLGLDYRIIDLGGEHFRVEDVVKFGVKPDEIVKTLLVRAKPVFSSLVGVNKGPINLQKLDKSANKLQYFVFALCGADRLNFKKVKRILGPSAELARAEEVLRVVGVPVGAVCPIGIGVPVYFDKRVLAMKNVNLGSGDLTCGLDMTLDNLLKAVGKYEVVDLT